MNTSFFRYLQLRKWNLEKQLQEWDAPPVSLSMWSSYHYSVPQKGWKYEKVKEELEQVKRLMIELVQDTPVIHRTLNGNVQTQWTYNTENDRYPYGKVLQGDTRRVGTRVDSLHVKRGHSVSLPEVPTVDLFEGRDPFEVFCSIGQVYAFYLCKEDGITREQSKALAAAGAQALEGIPREDWRLEYVHYQMACSQMPDDEEFVWKDWCEATGEPEGDFWERRNKTLWAI